MRPRFVPGMPLRLTCRRPPFTVKVVTTDSRTCGVERRPRRGGVLLRTGRTRRSEIRRRVRAASIAAIAGLLLLAMAIAAPAAATVSATAGGGAGVTVVVGCLDTPAGHAAGAGVRCGVLAVVCDGDGRAVTSVALVGLPLPIPGALVVRVGGACPGMTAAPPPPPTSPPPTSPPPTSPSPSGPPTAPPTATAPTGPGSAPPPSGPAPGAPPASEGSGQPPGSAASPAPAHAAGAPPAVSGAAASPRAAASAGTPAPFTFDAAPPGASPLQDPSDSDASRWWLLSLLGVMLPAALSAALPRGSGRRT